MQSDAPIFRFNEARPGIVDEVVRRVTGKVRDPLASLSDAVYHEVKRLSSSRGEGAELGAWRALARRLPTLSGPALHDELRKLAETHAWDVAGNFDPKVYALATRLMPPVLGAVIAPFATATSLRRLIDAAALADRIAVEGNVAHVRRLAEVGTVVYVPTHLSNMDSIVFGYALMRAGLPPATYGAGKNLFTNPLLSFFMHNLGAYKVDRRLRHGLYKDVLKAYSCVLIERGYHSLFFPGGTRSRSGGVERRLKLGLAGTGVEAFARTAAIDPKRPRRVFFVPATIGYLVTLEAETLIEDFLSDAGKNRYIIEDDESSRVERVAAFANKLLKHDGGVVVRFGEPLDPFGNRVDEEGHSLDARGRQVDEVSFVRNRKGEVVVDADRDAQYTRELGEAVCSSYLRHTVILATQLVATVMMDRLRRAGRTDDLFALLRIRQRVAVPRAEVARESAELRDRLLALEEDGKIVVGPGLRGASGEAIVREALRAWEGTHSTHVLETQGAELAIGHAPLVFYYQNRLAAHGLALDVLAPKREHAALTTSRNVVTPTLYESLLGSAWSGLAPAVRRLHGGTGAAHGTFRVRRGRSLLARIVGAVLGMPPAGEGVPVTLAVSSAPSEEAWTRSFAGQPLCTSQWREGPFLVEALGLMLCVFRLREVGAGLVFEQAGAAVGGRRFALPLPAFASPKITGRVVPETEGAHVDISISAPFVGLVIAYDGVVVPESR